MTRRFPIALLALCLAAVFAVTANTFAHPPAGGADPHAAPAAGTAAVQDTHAHPSGAAHDDHAHHEEVGALPTVKQGLVTGITALVVFALVAAFLGVKVWPTITKALDERANKIKDEIAAAEMAREQAKDALTQYEKNLAQARAEAQQMLDQAKSQQQALAAELRTKAEAELNMMREKAKRDIDAAKRAAINEIYSETISLATSAASKILQREIRPQDQQRLLEESLAEMGSLAGRA